ncbi:MAG: hypothetical protein WD066_18445 [Planctomycetaceae bacterium]
MTQRLRIAAQTSLRLHFKQLESRGFGLVKRGFSSRDGVMARKRDIRQIEAVAREFDMTPDERREFGDFIEGCKHSGERGSEPGGDFSYGELREKVADFRDERS